jgi:hypothetical protein
VEQHDRIAGVITPGFVPDLLRSDGDVPHAPILSGVL